MKRFLLSALLVLIGSITFAQELIIVVPPFDVRAGSGFSKDDVEAIEYLFLNELAKSKTIKVLDQSDTMFKETTKRMEFELSDWSNPKKVAEFGKALNANAVLLGRIITLVNELIIAVRINDLNTEIKAANDMIITNVSEVRGKLPAFTKEIVDRLPKPTSPLIGSWKTNTTSNNWEFNWLLIFNPDGTFSIQNYRVITERWFDYGSRNLSDIKGEVNGTYLISGNTITFKYTISGTMETWVNVWGKISNQKRNSYNNQGTATISFKLSENNQIFYINNDSNLFRFNIDNGGDYDRNYCLDTFEKIN